MPTHLKILFVTPEVIPFAKTGGLADVSSALPKAIKGSSHDIRLFVPKYSIIKNRKYILRDVIRLKDMCIPHGSESVEVNVQSSFLPNSKVQVYFLDFPAYFNRKELYIDPKTGSDYNDNAERFALFCRSAIEMLQRLHWQPDVIHCNDWQAALIPVYLKTLYKNDSFYRHTKTILTIHNVAYQGIFPVSKLKKINLPDELFYPGGPIEYYDKINFLKAGIEFTDFINTVSPTYSKEIQLSNEFGYGLEGVLQAHSDRLTGILNGVDYTDWNPETDNHIPAKYDFNRLEQKSINKEHLQRQSNLSINPDIPCIGSISRLADQKGFDLIMQVFDRIMELGLQFVILGKGDKKYHTFFKKQQKKYADRFSVQLRFDNTFAHLLEAGCDIFLMPSKYEPCGLNQLYSMRYGTIPIVRATGGLADTVVDFNPDTETGTGFVFQKYDANEMFQTLKTAIEMYHCKKVWHQMMANAMKQNFSWSLSSQEYLKLYSKLNKIL